MKQNLSDDCSKILKILCRHTNTRLYQSKLCGKYKFEFKDKITKKLGFKAIYETEASVNEQIEKLTKSSKLHITQAKIEHHETMPPSYFNEGTLLKAMESPQKFFKLNNKKYNETLKETGGIGTVATRADIIEYLI